MGGEVMDGVLDTGSSMTVMGERAFARMRARSRQAASSIEPFTVAVAGERHRCGRVVDVMVRVPAEEESCYRGGESVYRVHVLDGDMTCDVLFGDEVVLDNRRALGHLFACRMRGRSGGQDKEPDGYAAQETALDTVHVSDLLGGERVTGDEQLTRYEEAEAVVRRASTIPRSEVEDTARISESLSEVQRRAMLSLLVEHSGVFGGLSSEAPAFEVPLVVKEGAAPLTGMPQARVPKAHVEAATKWADEMIAKDVLEESKATAGHQMVVAVRNGKPRMCLACYWLNDNTEGQAFDPMPVRDCIDALQGANYITTMDLVSSFLQLRLRPSDRHLTAFRLGRRVLQFKRMMFGWKHATHVFQRFLTTVLQDCIVAGYVVVYVDDIVIFSRTWEEHLRHVREVLARLLAACLRASLTKCAFGAARVRYLGMEVDGRYVALDKARLQGLRELPEPTTISQLRSHLGMFSYCREFVAGYADMVRTLEQLVVEIGKTGRFRFLWEDRHRDAWRQVRDAICRSKRLMLPDEAAEYEVWSDASELGMGAGLWARKADSGPWEPVSFISRSFRGAEMRYPTIEKEALAVKWAVTRWRVYLLGRRFTVVTDHRNLLHMRDSSNARVQRWQLELQEYDFMVRHMPGVTNVVADALSRSSVQEVVALRVTRSTARAGVQDIPSVEEVAASAGTPATEEQRQTVAVAAAAEGDGAAVVGKVGLAESAELEDVLGQVAAAQAESPHRTIWEADSMYREVVRGDKPVKVWTLMGRAVIPGHATELQQRVLQLAHDRAGHVGVPSTLYHVEMAALTWATLIPDAKAYVAGCLTCQRIRGVAREVGRLHHIPVESPFRRVQMDFIGPISTDSAVGYILVIIDCFSRWVELVAMDKADGAAVVRAFTTLVLRRHGVPLVVQTDGGSHFVNGKVAAMFEAHGVQHHVTTPYRPQSNGLVERANREVITRMQTFLRRDTSVWRGVVEEVQWQMNTAYHSAVGMMPYEALFGRKPETVLSRRAGAPRVPLRPSDMAQLAEKMMVLVRERDAVVAERTAVGQRRVDARQYVVGEHVYLATSSVGAKLEPRWQGPYRVEERLEGDTYRLYDIGGRRETRAHAAEMKPAVYTRHTVAEDVESELPSGYAFVDEILGHEVRDSALWLQVRWRGVEGATWQRWEELKGVKAAQQYMAGHTEARRALAGLR